MPSILGMKETKKNSLREFQLNLQIRKWLQLIVDLSEKCFHFSRETSPFLPTPSV